MKPFNLEAAKAGALFCGPRHDPSTLAYRYVGLMTGGRIAFERSDGILACQPADALRMLPTITKGAMNIYRDAEGNFRLGSLHDTFSRARSRAIDGTRCAAYVGTASVEWRE